MADIKTRDMVKGTIKTIDKAAVAADRIESGIDRASTKRLISLISRGEKALKPRSRIFLKQRTAKASAKAAQKAAQAAKVAAIAAGGWVAVVVIIVICLIGLLLGSVFGIFFSGEDSGTGMSMQTVVQEINAEYDTKLQAEKDATSYDILEMSGSRAVWKDVLAAFRTAMERLSRWRCRKLEMLAASLTGHGTVSTSVWKLSSLIGKAMEKRPCGNC